MAIDQRGTGRDALDCPALQSAMGASDLTPPPRAAVTELRGRRSATERRFFTTRDTVADLEALRIALQGATSSPSTARPTARSSPSATRSPTPSA